jgi:ribokinase
VGGTDAGSSLDVLVVGVANVDLVTRVPALPDDGETVFGTELIARSGGKGLNQALAVAQHGGQVALAAQAGDDAWGHLLRNALIQAGVDISAFRLVPGGETAAVLVQVPPSGDSAVTVTRTSITIHTLDDIERARPLLERASVTIVQLELDPAVIATALGAARGVKVGTLAPLRVLPTPLLRMLDLLVVNATEAATILGEDVTTDGQRLAGDLVQLGPAAAVVTLGAGGAAYSDHGGCGVVPARQVTVNDTTGAGDAFLGALALDLSRAVPIPVAVATGVQAGTAAVEAAS